MEDLTIVDGVVALVVIISALLAYSRGFVRESLAILGWIGAAILAFLFADQVEPLVKQIPVIGGIIGSSCELGIIGAFALVFAVALVVFSIFTPLFSSLVQRSALGVIDQGLGFLFGVARGVLLVAVAFVVYDQVLSAQDIPMIKDSRSAEIFSSFSDNVGDEDLGAATSWLTTQYSQLVGDCGAPAE